MAASKAYILSNLWDTTLSGAAWDEPCVFNRTIAGPVDKFSIFPSLSSAEQYALTNTIAYPGQIITTVDEIEGKVQTYKIQLDGTLGQIDAETVYTTEATPTISSNIDENLKITSEIVSASIQPKHIDTNEVWYFDSNYAD